MLLELIPEEKFARNETTASGSISKRCCQPRYWKTTERKHVSSWPAVSPLHSQIAMAKVLIKALDGQASKGGMEVEEGDNTTSGKPFERRCRCHQ